jgi:molybdopterin molybdotransferase
VAALPFAEARALVVEKVRTLRTLPPVEVVSWEAAPGRVLGGDVRADRDYPPLARSVRDGFAVRAADLPGSLRVVGEVRAGGDGACSVGPGEAVEIMTGAPVPAGADAVVMIEYCRVDGDRLHYDRPVTHGEFIDPRASMCAAGAVVLRAGRRLDYGDLAMAATVGVAELSVYRRPTAAIVPTGDELVELGETPAPHQIRNSNAVSLACQARSAGATPVILPVARDTVAETAALIERGLEEDLLLLSGGVSAGKYDVVERALAGLGAEFYFDRVLIQPGQPLVFGRCRGKFFFGLPGNPASTMVCFEIFARAAAELLGGAAEAPLRLTEAVLATDFSHRAGLTRFLPAVLEDGTRRLTPLRWQGSGDVPALARANAYLVAEPDRPEYKAGDRIGVLPR